MSKSPERTTRQRLAALVSGRARVKSDLERLHRELKVLHSRGTKVVWRIWALHGGAASLEAKSKLEHLLDESERINQERSAVHAEVLGGMSALAESQPEIDELIAEQRAIGIRGLSQFIPKSHREGFLGDLLEDVAEWDEQGVSGPRIWWRVGVQVVIAVLHRPLLWKTVLGAWIVTKLKPLIGGE